MSDDVPKKGTDKVFSIRIKHDLYERISALAEKEHRDKNGQIVHYLERAIELGRKGRGNSRAKRSGDYQLSEPKEVTHSEKGKKSPNFPKGTIP